MKNSLESFRAKINALDDQILQLLGERLHVCRKVASFKKANNIPMMQPNRVDTVKNRMIELGKQYNLRADFINRIYSMIIAEACELEDEIIAQPN